VARAGALGSDEFDLDAAPGALSHDRQSPAVYVLDPDTYTDGRIVLG
jgi:hypothetical protein